MRRRRGGKIAPCSSSCATSASTRGGRTVLDSVERRGAGRRDRDRRPVGQRQVDAAAAAQPARRPRPRHDLLPRASRSPATTRSLLRREVSLVPQLPALLEGTVESNILYAAGLAGKELDPGRCLRLAGLDPEFAGRDVSRLSVGEQQRAMLARSLAQQPDVLLLDEPTSALDHAARDAIEATLAGLRQRAGISLVLVTHDPEQAGG